MVRVTVRYRVGQMCAMVIFGEGVPEGGVTNERIGLSASKTYEMYQNLTSVFRLQYT